MYPERHKQRDARQSTSRKSAPRSNQIQQDSNYVSKELRRHVCQNCRAHYDCICKIHNLCLVFKENACLVVNVLQIVVRELWGAFQ